MLNDTEDAVRSWGTAVYRMAYAMVRSRHDAEDVFQEVFLRFHRRAPRFESEEHRKAWLLRVTANCSKSLLASPWRKRTAPLEDTCVYRDPELSAVDEAMARLDPKYRAVVHLRCYEGYSTEEIAALLGRKPSTVRAQLSRARRKLAELLKEDL